MIKTLLSGDLPRSRLLSVVLVLILATLAAAPLLFPGAQAINTAAKICVFVVLAASYDLLLGYTGIVSFADTSSYGTSANVVRRPHSKWYLTVASSLPR